jgi:hypothetical protein
VYYFDKWLLLRKMLIEPVGQINGTVLTAGATD